MGGGLDEGLSPPPARSIMLVGRRRLAGSWKNIHLKGFISWGRKRDILKSVYFKPSSIFSGRLLGIMTARAEYIHGAVRIRKWFYFGLLAQPLTEA